MLDIDDSLCIDCSDRARVVKADDAALDAKLRARQQPTASKGADDERQAAIERWKSMVNGATKGDGRGVSHDEGGPPDPGRGKGRSGPDNDHGL